MCEKCVYMKETEILHVAYPGNQLLRNKTHEWGK
jgi:hypothetical protein